MTKGSRSPLWSGAILLEVPLVNYRRLPNASAGKRNLELTRLKAAVASALILVFAFVLAGAAPHGINPIGDRCTESAIPGVLAPPTQKASACLQYCRSDWERRVKLCKYPATDYWTTQQCLRNATQSYESCKANCG